MAGDCPETADRVVPARDRQPGRAAISITRVPPTTLVTKLLPC